MSDDRHDTQSHRDRETIRAACLLARGEPAIAAAHLPDGAAWRPTFVPRGDPDGNRRAVQWALSRSQGRVGEAARMLGAHRNTLRQYRETEAVERQG